MIEGGHKITVVGRKKRKVHNFKYTKDEFILIDWENVRVCEKYRQNEIGVWEREKKLICYLIPSFLLFSFFLMQINKQ
jgi:hypothetical protein